MPSVLGEIIATSKEPKEWEQLIDAEAVAALLNVGSTQTISNLVASKELRAIRVGRLLRFRLSDVEEYLRASMTKPVNPAETVIDVTHVLSMLPVSGKAGKLLFSIPLATSALRNFTAITVHWGDASAPTPAAIANGVIVASHTYEHPGTYTIEIQATANGLEMRNSSQATIL